MTDPKFPNAHALVVAISEYQMARKLPRVVIDDAEDIAAVLRSSRHCGYDSNKVRLLLDAEATKTALLAELDFLRCVSTAGDTVCIYFSGHGWRKDDSDDSYLMLVDSVRNDLDGTMVSATVFSDALHAIKADRLIVFVDACHAGGAGTIKVAFETDENKAGFSTRSIDFLSTGLGRAIVASSRSDETSLIMPGARNSAFTTALLEGLRGAADFHNEGVVKLFSLFEYVSSRVPDLTSNRQHPLLRTRLEKNIALALNLASTKSDDTEPRAGTQKVRELLLDLLPDLYPAGPIDQDIWERSGGDLSRLTLAKTGRSIWHEALRLLERGGGGDIDVKRLIANARRDFPRNDRKRKLIHALR